MKYTAENLLVHPFTHLQDPDLILAVTPESAGWDFISFQARRLSAGKEWSFTSGENELAIILLQGEISVRSTRGSWQGLERKDVWTSAATALYLPSDTGLTVLAASDSEFAVTWVPTDEAHEPWLIQPRDVPISLRGGDNASRQINDLLPPGSPVHRLVLVEVYTPGGNWSSYPPHKHDVHIEDEAGNLIEADLEEVYFYKIDKPEGYAYQQVYTDKNSPLQKAGDPIEALVKVRNNCAVLIPEGYHPVASAPGYTTYYLNVLAGSAQSLANQDDPRYSWIKGSYQNVDPRIPLYIK